MMKKKKMEGIKVELHTCLRPPSFCKQTCVLIRGKQAHSTLFCVDKKGKQANDIDNLYTKNQKKTSARLLNNTGKLHLSFPVTKRWMASWWWIQNKALKIGP